MSFQDCGFINGRPYVPVRRHWNKWDNWLESNRDSEGTKFDPVSFKAAMEAAKARGQIKQGPIENICRNCSSVIINQNRTHCEKCAAYFTQLKKRANEIVTRTCPECGKSFKKRLKARNVTCSEACRKKRHVKQQRGCHPVPIIRGTEY